jgi:hypothetical protein
VGGRKGARGGFRFICGRDLFTSGGDFRGGGCLKEVTGNRVQGSDPRGGEVSLP